MDNPNHPPAATPGYETRDADARGVFNFLIILGVVLVLSAAVCWGLFRYFSVEQPDSSNTSPFSDIRELPSGPQLQVNPREDLLRFRAEQEKALGSYAWENRAAGAVRVPIDRAMELLVQKGLPVQGATPAAKPDAPVEKGSTKH
jgi:hypothetical protein